MTKRKAPVPAETEKPKHPLVIVESPAKARTIEKFLGKPYRVMASMGHVRDLAKTRKGTRHGIDIEKGFEPTYRVIPKRREVVEALSETARKADAVYLAPDPDREGEAIAWHLAEALKLPARKAHRVTFHEITREAIAEAFRRAGGIDMSKVNAQQARRIMDRLMGFDLSKLLQRAMIGRSAGRVQSPAVRLIVEREREIQAFKPEEYWRLTAVLAAGGASFEAQLSRWGGKAVRTGAEPADRAIATQAEAEALLATLEGKPFLVAKVATQERRVSPPPPFTTSLLQQAAATALGFATKRTMKVAQQLYEGISAGPEGPVGLITYMRTDSVRFAAEAVASCREAIKKRFGPKYLPERPRAFKARKGAQEAHEAIRPTDFARTPESVKDFLSAEQWRLYRLIWSRAVASQMAESVVHLTQAEIEAGDCVFAASGRRVLFDGYAKVLARKDDGQDLPPLKEGKKLSVKELRRSQHFTQPPPRYGEATLVKALEKLGIGRPSTYAPIVSTIQDRGYVVKESRQLKPTAMGIEVTDALGKLFPEVVDYDFTSRMEEELDEVEEGKLAMQRVLSDFWGPFSRSVEKAEPHVQELKEAAEKTEETCPKCSRPLVVKLARNGRKFLGCSGYFEKDAERKCDYTRDHSPEAAVPTGILCDLCGGAMVRASGPFGPYLRCENRPGCPFTMKFDRRTGHPVRKFEPIPAGRACEKCGSPLVVRVTARGKRGPRPFLSCSGFPKCRHAADLPPELSGEGGKALARWQANAVKNKADLARYRRALGEEAEEPAEGGEPALSEGTTEEEQDDANR